MSAPNFNTWNGGIGADGPELPRRPSVDDLGGDQKQDNNEAPPDDQEHFTAGGWNQKVKQISASARVTASCLLDVQFDGSAPFLAAFSCPRDNLTSATFTLTDNGTGDTSITWPADTFPPHVISPSGFTPFGSAVVDGRVEKITNGIRVRTRSAGSAADVPFTIHIN